MQITHWQNIRSNAFQKLAESVPCLFFMVARHVSMHHDYIDKAKGLQHLQKKHGHRVWCRVASEAHNRGQTEASARRKSLPSAGSIRQLMAEIRKRATLQMAHVRCTLRPIAISSRKNKICSRSISTFLSAATGHKKPAVTTVPVLA